ncbi:ImmA/IrrE family metallo-endopeptidase [Vibrio sp.]|nr:ImmA/IrrE family metallo-endopeptidase [Vibrio sp.]
MHNDKVIYDTADKLLSTLTNNLVPTNLNLIAKKLNIELLPLQEMDENNLLGVARFDGERRIINYRSSENATRKRFIVAHEIAHHVLGHVKSDGVKNLEDTLSNFEPSVLDYQENEANKFALAILIPKSKLDSYIYSEGITKVAELSTRFNVSIKAMMYRLKHLGYSKW